MPKVSVIIPAYNSERTISESIESIIAQTYTDWEIIVCDDFSQDGTYEIANKYADINTNIKVIRNDENLGAGLSRNQCIQNTKGEYIVIQDADDIALPNRIFEQISFLDDNPEYAMVGAGCNVFNKDGVYSTMMPPSYPTVKSLRNSTALLSPTITFRRDALLKAGLYKGRDKVARAEDYELIARMYSRGYIGHNIQKVLILYRLEDEDYKKRKFTHRVQLVMIKYRVFKMLHFRWYEYIYIFKALVAGLIPLGLLKKYHRRKYSRLS